MSEVIRGLSKRIAVPLLPTPYARLDAHASGVGQNTEVVRSRGGRTREVARPTVVDGQKFDRGADEGFVANAAARHLYRFNDALSRYESTKASLLKGENPQAPEAAEYVAQKELDEMAELVRRFATEAGPDGSGAVTADMAAALGSLEKPQLAMILRRAGNPPLFQPLLGGDLAEVPMLREGDKAIGAMKVRREQGKIDKKASVESLPMIMRPSANYATPGDADAYKSVKPKDHDPMEFDANDPTIAESTKKYALNRLAGDQIAQAKKMETGGGRLTIGSGQSGDSPWVSRNSASKNPDKGKPIDQVVENRNKSAFRKLAETIDRAGYDKAGNATEGTFNIDAVFPRWRARVGELNKSGKLAYPARMPTAEYVTGMILGMHNFTEPGLFERWLPVVKRSIDAAPDAPSTKEAQAYSEKVFVPSPSFREVMAQGVGSKDYPFKIYGPRKVDLPKVNEPQAPQPKAAPAPAALQDRIDRLKKSRAKPGNADQSSIYTLPTNSPMSGLMA
jgi:hypothetical protein